jgi:hypothetical protein
MRVGRIVSIQTATPATQQNQTKQKTNNEEKMAVGQSQIPRV